MLFRSGTSGEVSVMLHVPRHPLARNLIRFYSGSAILSSSQTSISVARMATAAVPINNHITNSSAYCSYYSAVHYRVRFTHRRHRRTQVKKTAMKIRGCSYQINPFFRVGAPVSRVLWVMRYATCRERFSNPYSVEPAYSVKRKSLAQRNCYRIHH